ncbi:vegetative incompatibility protein HET-E-1 [Drosophila grimshawi]|nr:vegetative incompatibility protein HET-E-1 [Drosophila grimshawi]
MQPAKKSIQSNIEEEEKSSSRAKLKPREFVITGDYMSQLKVVFTSPGKTNVFPDEYSMQLPGLGIHHVALCSDSSCLAAISMDGNLTLLSLNGVGGRWLPSVSHIHVGNFWSSSFGGGGNIECIYAGSGSGHIYKYDTSDRTLQHSYDTHCCENVLGLAISKDQRLVGATDYAGNLTLFDGVTRQITSRTNYKMPMRRLVFDPSMQHALAACDDKTIKLIDLPSGMLRESLVGHDAFVMSVDVSPDGLRFLSGAFDGSIKLWDARTTKTSLAFMCGTNRNLWDVTFNKCCNKISCVGDGKGLNIYYCMGNKKMMLV